jgi:hypothetical protein
VKIADAYAQHHGFTSAEEMKRAFFGPRIFTMQAAEDAFDGVLDECRPARLRDWLRRAFLFFLGP